MTQSESGLSRWSRLKQEHAKGNEPDRVGLESAAAEEKPADLTAAAGATQAVPAPPPFDLGSLPPIQSITAGTDVRSFLNSNVPAELMRAALRRAWATDPVISGFIGIAESQWDFNDPAAMPGFGPLGPNDDIPGLLARIFDNTKIAFEANVEAADVAPPAVADSTVARPEISPAAGEQDPGSSDAAHAMGDPPADSGEA